MLKYIVNLLFAEKIEGMSHMTPKQSTVPVIPLAGPWEANDISPLHAIGIAHAWRYNASEVRFVEAELSRFNGLTLMTSSGLALRFNYPRPGDASDVTVQAAATILDLFGFSRDGDVLEIISGPGSVYDFAHESVAVGSQP